MQERSLQFLCEFFWKCDTVPIKRGRLVVDNDAMKSLTKASEELFSNLRKNQETFLNFNATFQKTVFPYIQRVSASLESPAFTQLVRTLSSIDFEGLSEAIKTRLKFWEIYLNRYDTELWAVDEELLESFWDGDYELAKLDSFSINDYVEAKLEHYMSFFDTKELFARHRGIIRDSYEAFKAGKYALSIFPLMAAIDYIFQVTFKDYTIQDAKAKPVFKGRSKDKTYYRAMDRVQSTEEELAFSHFVFRRVFKVYEIMFAPSWGEEPKNINRNWVMHGLYNYEKITKADVLKVFQLLKAVEIVSEITFVSTEV